MSGESPTLGARLAELGADLVTVEIDTIVKRGISSEKMPQPEHALMDMATEVWSFLIAIGVVSPMTDAEWDRDVQAGWSGWDACLRAVQKALESKASPGSADQNAVYEARIGKLKRIMAACDQLKGVLYDSSKSNGAIAGGKASLCGQGCVICRNKTTGAIQHAHNGQDVSYAPSIGASERRRWMPLDPRQLAVVRKIWEVGLEDIALQTVMQIDGDIVTRVDPAYMADERLMTIHREGVSASQALWKDLVDIAIRLFEAVAKRL